MYLYVLISPVRVSQQRRVVQVQIRKSRLNGVSSRRHHNVGLFDFGGVISQAVQSGVSSVDVAVVE